MKQTGCPHVIHRSSCQSSRCTYIVAEELWIRPLATASVCITRKGAHLDHGRHTAKLSIKVGGFQIPKSNEAQEPGELPQGV
jgi:hypothetical protein